MFIFRMVMLILNMTDPLLVVVAITVLISISTPVEEYLRRRTTYKNQMLLFYPIEDLE